MTILKAIVEQTDCPTELPSGLPTKQLRCINLAGLIPILLALERRDDSGSQVLESAANALSNWPQGFYDFLRSRPVRQQAAGLRKHFSGLYQALFKNHRIQPEEVAFLKKAFIEFGANEWGSVAVDCKFTGATPTGKRFISKTELSGILGIALPTVDRLIREGRIPTTTVIAGKSIRFVVDTANLNVPPKTPGKSYGVRDAGAFLGLPVSVLYGLRRAGDFEIRHLARPEAAFHERDLLAFSAKMLALVDGDYAPPQNAMTLEAVMRLKFRGDEGKTEFVQAALQREIEIVGCDGFKLNGLLFNRQAVDKFLLNKRAKVEGSTRSLTEAATFLSCDSAVVPALIQNGLLDAIQFANYRRVTEESLQEFDSKLMALKKLADEMGVGVRKLLRLCREMKVPLQAFARGYGKPDQAFLPRAYQSMVVIGPPQSQEVSHR